MDGGLGSLAPIGSPDSTARGSHEWIGSTSHEWTGTRPIRDSRLDTVLRAQTGWGQLLLLHK